MKITFIGQRGIPAFYSGIETRVEQLAVRMARKGHDITVYCRNYYLKNQKKPKKYKRVNLIYLPTIRTKHFDTIVHTFLASVHALFSNYDVIHYQAPGPSSLSWIIRFLKRNTLVVATYNSRDQYHQKWGFIAKKYLNFSEKIISTIPHLTITLTKSLKREVKKKYKKTPIYIPNGTAIKKTTSFDRLKKWGLKKNKYALTVNRLVKHKGIHLLIKAFIRLQKSNHLPSNFKLVIVGSSKMLHTTQYEKQLKKLTKNNKNIIFTGTQKRKALAQLFSNAYLFIHPSEAEGLSTVIIEAMGCGKALLVSDIKENLEAIGSSKNAITFKNKNTRDLTRKLKNLLDDPQKVKKLGKLAQIYAKKHYDWNKITKQHLKIYQKNLSQLPSRKEKLN
ncbi:MAG: glycosyltransferase family 4 protein [Patescibacteria group bacterium]|nr:glycosyltransferase family 4 protein [Patescibacteria group bacterium]